MIARMATPASKIAAGSVGTVDTQFLDLPKPLPLDCGRTLHPIRIAYETYGTLSPARDNVILVCHALSGDAHAAGFAKTPPQESTRDGFAAEDRDGDAGRGLGWWDGMIGPGKAFDTDQFFVVSTNLLGGCRGTTGPSSMNPATGQPYGSGLAGRPLLWDGPPAECRHGPGAYGRTHHVSVGEVAGRQVRPPSAIRRRHSLHPDGARVRG